MKKLLFYTIYFYPDGAADGQLFTELCDGLDKKIDITVICATPCYTGKIDDKYKKYSFYYECRQNYKIIRVRVPEYNKEKKLQRIKSIVTYFFKAVFLSFKIGKFDFVMASSQPPVLGGLLGVLGKWITRGRFIYNVQDFNPEQIMITGYSKNKFLICFLMYLDMFSCKHADRVILVGRDMLQTLKERFVNKIIPKYRIINNWADEKLLYPMSKENYNVINFIKKYGLESKFLIMYSGNLGIYYDLLNIIKVFEKFQKYEDVCFIFVGEGVKKHEMIKYVKSKKIANILFIPYQKKEELNYSMNASDVQIVCSAKGIKGVSVPSKIYGIMAVAKPVIGIVEPDSEVGMIITESGCGIHSRPGDYGTLEKNIEKILLNRNEFCNRGMNGKKYLDEHYSKQETMKKYMEIFND